MQRLEPFVGDSFRIADFLSELKSFVALGMVAKLCSPVSPSFTIYDTLVWSDTTESARLP
jgi:hypothetical protein